MPMHRYKLARQYASIFSNSSGLSGAPLTVERAGPYAEIDSGVTSSLVTVAIIQMLLSRGNRFCFTQSASQSQPSWVSSQHDRCRPIAGLLAETNYVRSLMH